MLSETKGINAHLRNFCTGFTFQSQKLNPVLCAGKLQTDPIKELMPISVGGLSVSKTIKCILGSLNW